MIQQPLTGKVKQKIMLEKNYLDANRQQIKEITANMQLTKIQEQQKQQIIAQ